jgi:hypothetical protein
VAQVQSFYFHCEEEDIERERGEEAKREERK